ncbi:MAM and LDL-receptor class A domain-containing protein 1-like [Lytechinus variegatus]|uniref:MAM and LDL-receptor class A domain-containing protein 1-like n=1 Tax=Lytechinus variegatus TaxID=7654 RepID=UPI001BB18208|nr:MAM and LDL-receptor class A domain-containing protein 1-like [Lytechinus variegatus]
MSLSNLKVIFEGIRGPNFQGDIALDDITFTTGDCGTPSYCGFENGVCGFTQPVSDVVQWVLTSSSPSSSSPTPTTAPYLPPFDATYRTLAGHFMYLELHDDQNNNDGGLSTGVFPTGTAADRCINVWFYMQNSVKISLKVIQLGLTSTNQNQLASVVGEDLADEWHVIQAALSITEEFKIIFQATNLDQNEDVSISIDEFKITDGLCPQPGSCDFENGFCTWKNEENFDDFDWQLIQGRTPSDNTGPPSDHTKGTSYGIYAYVETSGRATGDIAILKSSDFQSGSTQCLEFYYYMYGTNLGRLDVQALQDKETIGTTLRSYNGTQGSAWRQSLVNFDIFDGLYYTILFNASVGATGLSDIAIDDISVYPGNCSGRSDICDFFVDFCDWEQAVDDDTDWLIGSGSDSNDQPLRDHTTGAVGGNYAYIDFRDAQTEPGDQARLLSLERNPPADGQAECLGFWYHLNETDAGSLNIMATWVDNGTTVVTDPLWTISGNRGDQWWFGATTVVSKFPYQVTHPGKNTVSKSLQT